jgi:hypothetical protein
MGAARQASLALEGLLRDYLGAIQNRDCHRAAVHSQCQTKVAANWFQIRERATASGFGSLAMYFGILLGLVLTPYLDTG